MKFLKWEVGPTDIKVYEDTKSFDEVVAYIHKQSTMGLHDDVGPYIKDIR